MIRPFTYTGAKKIVFGTGSFRSLADHIRELGGARPLIVLDHALAEAGFRKTVKDLLDKSGLRYSLFDGVEPNRPWRG